MNLVIFFVNPLNLTGLGYLQDDTKKPRYLGMDHICSVFVTVVVNFKSFKYDLLWFPCLVVLACKVNLEILKWSRKTQV